MSESDQGTKKIDEYLGLLRKAADIGVSTKAGIFVSGIKFSFISDDKQDAAKVASLIRRYKFTMSPTSPVEVTLEIKKAFPD